MVVTTNLRTGFASVDNLVQMDQKKMVKVFHFNPVITKLNRYTYVQDTRTVIATNETNPKILQTTNQVSPNFKLTICQDKVYLKYDDALVGSEICIVNDAHLNISDLESLMPTKVPSSFFSSISQSVPDDAIVIGNSLIEVYHKGLQGVVSADRAAYNRNRCIATWGFDPSSYTPVVEPKTQRAAVANMVTASLMGGRQKVFSTQEGVIITASSQASAAEFAEAFAKGVYRDDLAKATFLMYALPTADVLASDAEYELVLSPATLNGSGKIEYLDGNNQKASLSVSYVAYASGHALLGLAEDIKSGSLRDHVSFASCKNSILTTMGKNFTRVFRSKLKELNLALADNYNNMCMLLEATFEEKFPVTGEGTIDVPTIVSQEGGNTWGDPGFTELFAQDFSFAFEEIPNCSHKRATVGENGVFSLEEYDPSSGTMNFFGAKWVDIPKIDKDGNDKTPLTIKEKDLEASMNVLKQNMTTVARSFVRSAMDCWHDPATRGSQRISIGGVYERHRCRIFCKATTIDEDGISKGTAGGAVSSYNLNDLSSYNAYCPQVLAIFKTPPAGEAKLIRKGEAWNTTATSLATSITPNDGEEIADATIRVMSDINSYKEGGILYDKVIATSFGTYVSYALKRSSNTRNKTLYNNYLVTDVALTHLTFDDVIGKVSSLKGDLNFKFSFAPVIAFNARHSVSSLTTIVTQIVSNMFAPMGGSVTLCGTNFYIPTDTSSYHYGHNNHDRVSSHVPGTGSWLQAAPMYVFNVNVPGMTIQLESDVKSEINSWVATKSANAVAAYLKQKQAANVLTAWTVAVNWLEANMKIFGTLKDEMSMTVWAPKSNQYLSIEAASLFSDLKVGVGFDKNSATLSLKDVLNVAVDKVTGEDVEDGSSSPSYSVSSDSIDTSLNSLAKTDAESIKSSAGVWLITGMPTNLKCQYSPATAGMYMNF